MGKKGEESMAKFSGGAVKGRSQNDSRSQAPVIHRVILRSDSLRGSGLVIADSLDSKKKKKKEEEKRKKK